MKLPVDYTSLTPSQRRQVRHEYIRIQDNKCMYCKESLDKEPAKEIIGKPVNWKLFPDNFTKYPVHLQHCHKTRMTEGAVHMRCNAVMWQYEGR